MRLVKKIIANSKKHGLFTALKMHKSERHERKSRKLVSAIGGASREQKIAIIQRKQFIVTSLTKLLKNTVKYGPFAGFKLATDSWWGGLDKAAMLFGFYEQQILNIIVAAAKTNKFKTFIDIGAADGYYAVGTLYAGLFDKAYAFEISEHGQKVIAQNAQLNQVSEKITIFGAATPDFYEQLAIDDLQKAVVLIDIEGAEFEVLQPHTLKALSQSLVVVEIHDWGNYSDSSHLINLITAAEPYFEAQIIKSGPRDLSVFPELDHYDDYDRALLYAEGRPKSMSWLVLTPRNM